MANKDLKLNSIHIDHDIWYYEEPKGLGIVFIGQDRHTKLVYISWDRIRSALKRKETK